MKKKSAMFLFMILMNLFSLTSFSQDMTQLDFMSGLDDKTAATYGDAVKMFRFQSGTASEKAVTAAKKKGAAVSGTESFMLAGYSESATLTRGMAALMTAKYLDLGGSFMYLIFGSERYAYRACIANGIMISDGSENDIFSGPELLELFSKIHEFKGGE